MALTLDKVNRGSHLPTLVATSIAKEIAQGRLNPGDKLPFEQALAETFAVSRNVVREAIARLRSEGRVWSRQGRGAFVSDSQAIPGITVDHEALKEIDALRSLYELRGILEVEAAGLAAQRRTGENLAAIRETMALMEATVHTEPAQVRNDLAFHRAVAAASGNMYLVEFLMFVSDRIGQTIELAGKHPRTDAMKAATLTEHEAIAAAISARDAEVARRAMRAHLIGAAGRIGLDWPTPAAAPPAAAKRRRTRPASPG